MSHPHAKSLPVPGIGEQTKILIAEHPGKTGLLLADGQAQPMTFKNSKAALAWCEKNATTFYYLPPAAVAKN